MLNFQLEVLIMRNLLVILLLFIVAGLVWGMGSAPKKEEYKLEILKMEVVPTPAAITAPQEIKITAKRFQYSPNAIEVKMGIPVRLILTSLDTTHGFSLPDFKVEKTIAPGKQTIVEFTPDKIGEFHFHCSVYCGSGHGGMHGKLIVK